MASVSTYSAISEAPLFSRHLEVIVFPCGNYLVTEILTVFTPGIYCVCGCVVSAPKEQDTLYEVVFDEPIIGGLTLR